MRLPPGTYKFKNSGTTGLTIRVDNIPCGILAGDVAEFTAGDSILFTEGSTLSFVKSTPRAVVQTPLDEGVPTVHKHKKVFSSKKY